jgi:hypothetical protein
VTFATSPATKSTRGRVQFLLADKTETLNDNGVENSVGRWQMAVGTFLEKIVLQGTYFAPVFEKDDTRYFGWYK